MSLARLLAVVCEPPFVLPRGTFAVRLDQDFFLPIAGRPKIDSAPCGLAGRTDRRPSRLPKGGRPSFRWSPKRRDLASPTPALSTPNSQRHKAIFDVDR